MLNINFVRYLNSRRSSGIDLSDFCEAPKKTGFSPQKKLPYLPESNLLNRLS